MRKKGLVLFTLSVALLFFVVSLSPQVATAQLNTLNMPSYSVTSSSGAYSTASTSTFIPPDQPDCAMLVVEDQGGTGKIALNMLGYTYTPCTAAQVAAVNLDDFDLLYVPWQPTQAVVNALNARAGELAEWIKAGGGIIVNAEWKGSYGVANPYSFLPVAFDTANGFYHTNGVDIVVADHPLVANLTDADLDMWCNSVHGKITVTPDLTDTDISEYTVVAVATQYDSPHIVGMCYGLGKIVVASSDPSYHILYGPGNGPGQLLCNEILWACEPCAPPDCCEILEAKLDMIESKLDAMESLGSSVEALETKLDVMECKLDTLATKQQRVLNKLNQIINLLDKIEVKLDNPNGTTLPFPVIDPLGGYGVVVQPTVVTK